MSDASPSGVSPRPIPHIPIEIARKIAMELDLPSALNLTRSCKALRDVGELAVWRTLDFTNDWYESIATIKADFEATDPTLYRAGAAAINSKVKHALLAFRAYPFRRECVTRIRIEPSDGILDVPLLELLTFFLPHITHLAILPRPCALSIFENQPRLGPGKFFAVLGGLPRSIFTRITHLKLTCLIGCEPIIPTFVQHLPNLQDLDYCCSKYPTLALATETAGMRPFPNLLRLTFHQVDLHYLGKTMDVLAVLVELAPDLEYLAYRGRWNPQAHHRALKAMSKAKRLKTLVFSDSGGEARTYLSEEPGARFRNIGRLDMAMEEAVVDMGEWNEGQELDLELRLPAASDLRRVTVLMSARIPLEDYTDLGIGPTPDATRPICGVFLQRLSRAKSLSHILIHHLESYFPSPYSRDFQRPTYFIPPDRWAEGGYRGLIIREYRRPTYGQVDDSPLWHIKALSRSMLHCSGQFYVGSRRCWQDFTSFKGRRVPRHVLRAVYEQAGHELASTAEGRGLTLCAAAFDTLDVWRMGAGPDLTAEGDCPSEWGYSDDAASETQSSEGGENGAPHFMMGPHFNADGAYEDDDGPFGEDEYSDYEPF